MATPNFIFASLADVDFDILDALTYVEENRLRDLTEDQYKMFIIECLIFKKVTWSMGISNRESPETLARTRKYLEGAISVTFSDTQPQVDHGGGSAAYDTNLGYGWRI